MCFTANTSLEKYFLQESVDFFMVPRSCVYIILLILRLRYRLGKKVFKMAKIFLLFVWVMELGSYLH